MVARWTAVTACAVVVVGATACGASPEPTPVGAPTESSVAEAPLDDGPDVDDDAHKLVDPLTVWFTGGLTYQQLDHLEDQLVADCMSRAGYKWIPADRPPAEPPTRGALAQYRETYGYGLFTFEPEVTSSSDPNLDAMREMTDAELDGYLTALEGPFAGGDRNSGCRGAAHDEAFGVVEARSSDSAAAEMSAIAMADPRLDVAREDWSRCMTAAGYPDIAQAPDVVAAVARAGSQSDSPRDYELAVATADVKCANVSTWPAQWLIGTEIVASLDALPSQVNGG